MIHPDDIRLCNCAMCKRELLGEQTMALAAQGAELPDEYLDHDGVCGRVEGRPYCAICLWELEKPVKPVKDRLRYKPSKVRYGAAAEVTPVYL